MKNVFDIRMIIAALFAIYGVVVTVMGLLASSEDIERADGVNINLWSGLGMIGLTIALLAWARWRPIRVPATTGEDQQNT